MQKSNSMTELSQRLNEIDPELVARKQKQISGLRYKLYIFLCAIWLLFFWWMFTGAVERVRWLWALPLWDIFTAGPQHVFLEARGEGWLLNDIEVIEKNITAATDEIAAIKEESEIIVELNTTGKQYTLAKCVNDKICNDIKPKLMENLPFFRTYIILGSSEAQKMDFNQKLLLKSILEYLLKNTDWTDNGKLLGLHFWAAAVLDEQYHLYKLPLSLDIEFENKQNFLSFLKNVEQRINFLLPVVYKVDSVDYDIVQYKFKQTIQVALVAYFYNPPEVKGSKWDTWTWGRDDAWGSQSIPVVSPQQESWAIAPNNT